MVSSDKRIRAAKMVVAFLHGVQSRSGTAGAILELIESGSIHTVGETRVALELVMKLDALNLGDDGLKAYTILMGTFRELESMHSGRTAKLFS